MAPLNLSEEDSALVADVLQKAPKLNESLNNVVIIDCIPKVPESKEPKLISALTKICGSNVMRIVGGSEGITLPRDEETGLTKGYCFIEYETAAMAETTVKNLNGYKLDRVHTFSITQLGDYDRFMEMNEEYTVPNVEDYLEHRNLKWWLQDESCCDQYVVRHDHMTSIYRGTKEEPELVHSRQNWTETYASFSPKGSYLATFHHQGIALWGGSAWDKIVRFSHTGVKYIDFSPMEKYLVTWSSEVTEDPNDPNTIIVWNVKTGKKERGFLKGATPQLSRFQWSHDDAYFARIGEDQISIYETPSMKILDRKSLKVPGVKDIAWSPTDNTLAFWVPERDQNPARVVVMAIPSRVEIAVKNLFNVTDCKLHWQENGDFLCVKVDRQKKKTSYTNFELFRMREKQVPVDVLEMRENIIAFAWEPNGSRFGIVHGETNRISVSFYQLEPLSQGGKVKLLGTLEKKQVTHLYWSPKGNFCVLAGLGGSYNGVLEFWDINDMVCVNAVEHFMCTNIAWDPTGRFVVSSVTYWLHQMENGFFVWSATGRLLHRHAMDKFYQLQWRPRPKSLLSNDELRRIKKNLKQYSTKFDMTDLMSTDKASKELIEKRRALMQEYIEYRQLKDAEVEAEMPIRVSLRGGITFEDEAADLVEEEEWIEEFIRQTVEFV